MTAYGTIESAVEAMRLGAFDYIQKPFTEQELLVKVAKALDNRRLAGEVTFLASEFKDRYKFENIIGRSRAVREVLGRIVRIAPTDAIVLITGESGTGKELVAKAIHANSKRARAPVRPGQLRRHHRDAARERALRPRQGLVHRRGQRAQGPLRRGRRRHLLLRRDRRDAHHVPGQAPARHPGERDPPRRREQADPRQRARHRGDQPGPPRRGRREALPPGPLLPPERRALPASAAARAARGHPRPRRLLPREVRPQDGRAAQAPRQRHRRAHALRLPGQHPGARAHDRAGRRARCRTGSSPPTTCFPLAVELASRASRGRRPSPRRRGRRRRSARPSRRPCARATGAASALPSF